MPHKKIRRTERQTYLSENSRHVQKPVLYTHSTYQILYRQESSCGQCLTIIRFFSYSNPIGSRTHQYWWVCNFPSSSMQRYDIASMLIYHSGLPGRCINCFTLRACITTDSVLYIYILSIIATGIQCLLLWQWIWISLHRILPANIPIWRTVYLIAFISANDARHRNFLTTPRDPLVLEHWILSYMYCTLRRGGGVGGRLCMRERDESLQWGGSH